MSTISMHKDNHNRRNGTDFWDKPSSGTVKLNIDASVKENGSASIGGITWDEIRDMD